MKKILFILMISIYIAGTSLALYQAKLPDLKPGTTTFYTNRVKSTGQIYSREKQKVLKDKNFIITTTSGTGETKEGKKFTRNTTTYYAIKNGLLTVQTYIGLTSEQGRPLEKVWIKFDWPKKIAFFKRIDHVKNETKNKTIKIDHNTVLAQDSRLFFQNLLNKDKDIEEQDFTILIPNGDTLALKASIPDKIEFIKVGKKSIPCLHVKMKPDVGWLSGIIPDEKPNLGPISELVPEVGLWFLAKPPYSFVRYQGPESGPLSPIIIQEIAE